MIPLTYGDLFIHLNPSKKKMVDWIDNNVNEFTSQTTRVQIVLGFTTNCERTIR